MFGSFQQQIFPLGFFMRTTKIIFSSIRVDLGVAQEPYFLKKNRPIGDNWTEITLFLLFTTVDAEVLKFERYELKISVSNNVLVYLTNKKRIRLIS